MYIFHDVVTHRDGEPSIFNHLFPPFLFLVCFFYPSIPFPLCPTISFPPEESWSAWKAAEPLCWVIFEAEKRLFGTTARAQHWQAGQAQAWSCSFVLNQDLTPQNQINTQPLRKKIPLKDGMGPVGFNFKLLHSCGVI